MVVGESDSAEIYAKSFLHAVTWANAAASPQALPVPKGSLGYSYATSINSSGDIVGGLGITLDKYNAGVLTQTNGVIWKNGQVKDLNSLIPPDSTLTLGPATTITDQGLILGTISINGTKAQYILIPK